MVMFVQKLKELLLASGLYFYTRLLCLFPCRFCRKDACRSTISSCRSLKGCWYKKDLSVTACESKKKEKKRESGGQGWYTAKKGDNDT